MNYAGKSNSQAEAKVAEGPHSSVSVLLGNPNTTSVTGSLYLRDGPVNLFLTKFTVDGELSTLLEIDKPLDSNQSLYLTLDAAPTAQITIWTT